MKKILYLLIMLTFLLGFVGCDPGSNTIDEELLKNTVKIELYSYENTDPKLLKLNGKKQPTFDFSKATLIGEFDESVVEDVVKDIAGRECFVYGNALNEPIGKTLILYQDNGGMVVLFGCVYEKGNRPTRYFGECNVFDENGVFVEHIGRIPSDFVDTLEATYLEINT